jgi:hypothetical protein
MADLFRGFGALHTGERSGAKFTAGAAPKLNVEHPPHLGLL